nr:hypothetical protein [Tanacetum cinerariifolium]
FHSHITLFSRSRSRSLISCLRIEKMSKEIWWDPSNHLDHEHEHESLNWVDAREDLRKCNCFSI